VRLACSTIGFLTKLHFHTSDSDSKNLFPVRIENVLTTHPSIREAAAIAVPDDVYGEVVGVWIVRDPSHADSPNLTI
jgi:acyl-CoA synthetase (AMP-forming)/AMP-acid ligase II